MKEPYNLHITIQNSTDGLVKTKGKALTIQLQHKKTKQNNFIKKTVREFKSMKAISNPNIHKIMVYHLFLKMMESMRTRGFQWTQLWFVTQVSMFNELQSNTT